MPDAHDVNANAAIVARLQDDILRIVGTAVPRPPHIVLLDYPLYSNVGDSAIYAGQRALFERLWTMGPAIVSVQSPAELALVPALAGDAPVFIQGGGNFGDLWPSHQSYRETVLERLRGRDVIQLPQSLHFDDPAALDRAARAIERHGRLRLFVRDAASLAVARANFACETMLCPDMAFMLGMQPRPIAATRAVTLLLRRDTETCMTSAPKDAVDWAPRMRTFPSLRQRWADMLAATPAVARHAMRWRVRRYDRQAERRLAVGLRMLSAGERVVTDRLHGHILCLLLGIPHIVLDSRSRKTTAMIDTWTTGGAFDICASLDEAMAAVRDQSPRSAPGRAAPSSRAGKGRDDGPPDERPRP